MLYIFLQSIIYIYFLIVLSIKSFTFDRPNNPKTFNLKLPFFYLLSNSCCADTNNFTKLLRSSYCIILTIHEIL
jgi:hypothetical protein